MTQFEVQRFYKNFFLIRKYFCPYFAYKLAKCEKFTHKNTERVNKKLKSQLKPIKYLFFLEKSFLLCRLFCPYKKNRAYCFIYFTRSVFFYIENGALRGELSKNNQVKAAGALTKSKTVARVITKIV